MICMISLYDLHQAEDVLKAFSSSLPWPDRQAAAEGQAAALMAEAHLATWLEKGKADPSQSVGASPRHCHHLRCCRRLQHHLGHVTQRLLLVLESFDPWVALRPLLHHHLHCCCCQPCNQQMLPPVPRYVGSWWHTHLMHNTRWKLIAPVPTVLTLRTCQATFQKQYIRPHRLVSD